MTTHGMTYTPEHLAWRNMRKRCNSPGHMNYKDYGGRGIAVCRRWDKFENFYKDMGPCPSQKHEIDRKNNNKGYSPRNCHWVLSKPNRQNMRSSRRWHIRGVTFLSMNDASLLLGVVHSTIHAWCNGYTRKGKYHPPKPGCYSYPAYPKGAE